MSLAARLPRARMPCVMSVTEYPLLVSHWMPLAQRESVSPVGHSVLLTW